MLVESRNMSLLYCQYPMSHQAKELPCSCSNNVTNQLTRCLQEVITAKNVLRGVRLYVS